jgi:aladin
MQWKPLSGNTLAVGCRYGVCVWSIVSKKVQRPNIAIKEGDNDANANSYQEQSAWMTYLKYPGHAPVNCLAWSPCENLLAAGSVSSHRVVVWDTALDQPIPLNEITLGAGITMLKWSPNGHYLFAATTKSTFHVWETKTWRCEKWSNLKTYVQTAAWSSDSRYLAIAASGDSSIHFIEFPSHPPQIAAQYIGTEDVGPYSVTLGSGREVTVGGNIKELAWDMTGQRLVVSFMDNNQAKKDNSDRAHAGAGLEAVKKRLFTEEDGENSAGTGEYSDTCHSLFALFATRSTPVVNLEPMGFIRGPPSSSSPLQISFRPNFPKGALLTAVSIFICNVMLCPIISWIDNIAHILITMVLQVWASGKISFFPLYFKTD